MNKNWRKVFLLVNTVGVFWAIFKSVDTLILTGSLGRGISIFFLIYLLLSVFPVYWSVYDFFNDEFGKKVSLVQGFTSFGFFISTLFLIVAEGKTSIEHISKNFPFPLAVWPMIILLDLIILVFCHERRHLK